MSQLSGFRVRVIWVVPLITVMLLVTLSVVLVSWSSATHVCLFEYSNNNFNAWFHTEGYSFIEKCCTVQTYSHFLPDEFLFRWTSSSLSWPPQASTVTLQSISLDAAVDWGKETLSQSLFGCVHCTFVLSSPKSLLLYVRSDALESLTWGWWEEDAEIDDIAVSDKVSANENWCEMFRFRIIIYYTSTYTNQRRQFLHDIQNIYI